MLLKEFAQLPNFVELVETELRRLAAENPDFIYNPSGLAVVCSYTGPAIHQGEQIGPDCDGCIFGVAIKNLGVEDMEGRKDFIKTEFSMVNATTPKTWQMVQTAQDNGKSWGEAIKLLDKENK